MVEYLAKAQVYCTIPDGRKVLIERDFTIPAQDDASALRVARDLKGLDESVLTGDHPELKVTKVTLRRLLALREIPLD